MIHLNHTLEIVNGGAYSGNHSWNKKHSEIDNCFKVYLLTEGQVSLCQGDEHFSLKKGNLYFINGNKLTRQYCEGSFSTHWLHFIPKDLMMHQGLLALPLVVGFPADTFGSFEALKHIDQLISANCSSYTDYCRLSLQTQIFLQSLIVRLMERQAWAAPKQADPILRIEPAIRWMNGHFTEPIRLRQVADLCCVSPNYFHKLFTSTMNTTPTSYITLLRMNTALQLLIGDRYQIKEIAYQVGFSDDAYFSRVFKKYYGMPPGVYKKRRREILF